MTCLTTKRPGLLAKLMTTAAAGCLVLAGAAPALAQSAPDTSFRVTGFADASFVYLDNGITTSSEFTSMKFTPIFQFQYQDLVLFEAELEIENAGGETEVALEYAQADFFVHPNAVIVVGRFLSPFGQFFERLHPSWINRMADTPAGFGHGGLQPISETGIQVRGGFELDPGTFTYSIALGNGPRVGEEGDTELEAFDGDDNDNKAISGRFGLLVIPNLELGASFLTAKVVGLEAEAGPGLIEPTEADLFQWGADFAYTGGAWDIRGEYIRANRDPINTAVEHAADVEEFPTLESTAWYLQLAYRLSGTAQFPALANVEPTLRYGEYDITGNHELAEHSAENRWDVGVNYWMTPSLVAKTVLQRREFTAREPDEVTEETRLIVQVAYGF